MGIKKSKESNSTVSHFNTYVLVPYKELMVIL